MFFIVFPSIHRIFIHGFPDLHITNGPDISFVFVKIQTFFIPLQAKIIDQLLANRFLTHYQFFILHREYLAGEQVLPMGHQALIVQIILAKLRQLEGPLPILDIMKKYRETAVQRIALTVDNTSIWEQGLDDPLAKPVPRRDIHGAV